MELKLEDYDVCLVDLHRIYRINLGEFEKLVPAVEDEDEVEDEGDISILVGPAADDDEEEIGEESDLIRLVNPVAPDLKVVANFGELGLPLGMGAFTIGSKTYLVGGERVENREALWAKISNPCEYSDEICLDDPSSKSILLNRKVYELNHDDLTICESATVPPMGAAKTHPMVAQLDGKAYVLGSESYFCHRELPSPVFEVYDPDKNSWTPLPDPLSYHINPAEGEEGEENINNSEHACEVKYLHAVDGRILMHEDSGYIWEFNVCEGVGHWSIAPYCIHQILGVSASYKGLTVAYTQLNELMAFFPPDGSTNKRLHRRLKQLNYLLPFDDDTINDGYIFHLGGGKMCFLWIGVHGTLGLFIFQVHFDGRRSLQVDLLRHRVFGTSLGIGQPYNAFLRCRQPDMHKQS